MERLEDLVETVRDALEKVHSLSELDALADGTIGKRSNIADARRGLGALPDDERRQRGALINQVVTEAEALISKRRAELEIAESASALDGERLDMTLPGRIPSRGTHHLITETMEEISDIFVSLGYTLTSGPEVETAWYNFDALNMPADHPARLEWDTLYVEHDDDPEGVVLRTHTSPLQARFMEANAPPVYVVAPGKVYRRDTIDPTHTPVFHQIEGLAVDADITFADLRGTLAYFARQFFGPERKLRLLPSHFRFTEPSAEGSVDCFACDGSGCRVCAYTGWIELFGCGMVHPAVFEAVGYDPETLTGFAFGMGADRAAQVRHGISDLRYFWDGDLRVLGQFR